MTPSEFRQLALSLPGAIEKSHMGHADFRVQNKVFATLGHPDVEHAMVKLSPADQTRFHRSHPHIFSAVKGGWGARGATLIVLENAIEEPTLAALAAAHARIAPKGRTRKHP